MPPSRSSAFDDTDSAEASIRVAIVHYHLQPGGVTRVIESSSLALGNDEFSHVILHGGEESRGCRIPGLGYLTTPGSHTVESLLAAMRHVASEALGGPPDVWHFHNHSLGKNCLIPAVVSQLAEAGERLILQIHDLAEDGRAENYARLADCESLYPVAPHVCYAFINSRDQEIFIRAGLPLAQAILLPNPISPTDHAAPVISELRLFAPIRGIRRKNLGELVLLSALAPKGSRVAVSRAPQNQEAQGIHEFWQDTARELDLAIEFNVTDRLAPACGATTDFASWIAHSSHFVSSSVAEGFGLPFLEAAALGKPMIGRKIPSMPGTEFGGQLYDRLLVPREWISESLLTRHLEAALTRTYRDYQRECNEAIFEDARRCHYDQEHFDFANLPEGLQRCVVEKLSVPSLRKQLLVEVGGSRQIAEDWLAAALSKPSSPALLEPYSLAHYRDRLGNLYRQVMARGGGFHPPSLSSLNGIDTGSVLYPSDRVLGMAVGNRRHGMKVSSAVVYLPKSSLLDAYLTPSTFHFLRTSPPRIPLLSTRFRAVIFDVYGTLLISPKTGVHVDPAADAGLRDIIESFGYIAPASPSTELHAAVRRYHASSAMRYPEVDLRELWREILSLDSTAEIERLIDAIETDWHPSHLMPGAEDLVGYLSESGLALGLLSNAQCHTLSALGSVADAISPDLTLLSYREGIAKPAPELFQTLVKRLAERGISPHETLFIGNDPLQDILPAAAVGMKTALFTGHPLSLRPGDCHADCIFQDFLDLIS